MAHLTYPFTITPNTLASASQVMGNFDAIKNILNGGIDGTNLADGAVLSGKLANDAVVTAKVKDKNITTSKLDDGAVTTAKINNGAVTAAKIDDEAVTTAKINDEAVTTAKIADGAVTQAKIATDAVTSAHIQGLYYGRVNEDGTSAGLPSGWSSELNIYGPDSIPVYVITHNLGHTNYNVLVTPTGAGKVSPSNPGFFAMDANIGGGSGRTPNSIGFVLTHRDDSSFFKSEFAFILIASPPSP